MSAKNVMNSDLLPLPNAVPPYINQKPQLKQSTILLFRLLQRNRVLFEWIVI